MNRTHHTSRLGRRLTGTAVGLAALTASLAIGAPASAIPPGGPDGPEPPRGKIEPVPDTPNHPPTAPGLKIRRPNAGQQVLARAFDVTITGRSEHSLNTRLERRSDDGRWIGVTNRHQLVGDYMHRDDGLEPDTRYCYRAVARNFAGETASPVQCAVTRAEEPQPVARIQLQLGTTDIGGAGTRDGRTAASLALGNSTWLDRPGADFARGISQTFDLIPAGISDMTDIEHLRISGGADDAWCLDFVRLSVNSGEVFREDFDAEPDGCRWFGRGRSTVLKFSHRTMRDNPSWRYPRLRVTSNSTLTEVEVNLRPSELTARLETLIGHALHGQRARWRSGGVTLSDSVIRDDYVHVTAHLEGSQELTPFGGTVWVDVDVDFDLFLAVRQSNVGDDVTLNVDPRNVNTSFSPLLTWAGRIFDLGPCGPIASIVTGDGIPGCFAAIERAMDRGVQAGLSGVGVNATIPGSPQCCEYLELVIARDGGVTLLLGLVTEEDDPPIASSDIPAATAVEKSEAEFSSEPVPGGGRPSPTRPASVEPILPGRADRGSLNPAGRVDPGAKILSR